MKIKILSILLWLPLISSAASATVGDYTYKYVEENGGAVLGDGSYGGAISPEPTGDFIIPNELDGLPVTRIRGRVRCTS